MNAFILASCLLAVASANPGLAGLGYSGLGYSSLGYSNLGYSGLGYAGLGYSGLGYATPYAAQYAAPYAAQYATPYAAQFAVAPVAVAPVAAAVSSQHHAQDELGQYTYGYNSPLSSKQETRTADGITRGGYSYVDANGLVQSTSYVSDPIHGFRVAATNLPVAPVAPAVAVAAPIIAAAPAVIAARAVDPISIAQGDTVEVAAAKAEHFHAHAVAKAGLRYKRGLAYAATPLAYAASPLAYTATVGLASEARQIDPVAIAQGAPLPTGDTVEVAAAKFAHLQAHAAASYRNYGVVGYAAPAPLAYSGYAHAAPIAYSGYAQAAPVAYAGYAHATPLAYTAAIGLASEARQIDPVAIAQGAPLPTGDTVEVAAAKFAHLQAHAKASHGIHY